MPCQHCQRPKLIRSRGLCYTCYDDHAIRVLYDFATKPAYEPTQEEVDRIVAEQLECLPSWWWKQWERPDEDETTVQPEKKIGVAVERGRGLRVRGS
jgi:hypothetical protein